MRGELGGDFPPQPLAQGPRRRLVANGGCVLAPEPLRTVVGERFDNQVERLAVKAGVGADGGAAGAIEDGESRALGGDGQGGADRLVAQGGAATGAAASSVRVWMASAPCPGAGGASTGSM